MSEFISFITSEASQKCAREKRKTVNGSDLIWALSVLGTSQHRHHHPSHSRLTPQHRHHHPSHSRPTPQVLTPTCAISTCTCTICAWRKRFVYICICVHMYMCICVYGGRGSCIRTRFFPTLTLLRRNLKQRKNLALSQAWVVLLRNDMILGRK